jgi:iron complex outermembrane recepter protein
VTLSLPFLLLFMGAFGPLGPSVPLGPAGPPGEGSGPWAATVAGVVVAADTDRPIPGVTVRIPALGRGTLTNAMGEFRLEGIPAGVYSLRVEALGYRVQELDVTLHPGESLELRIALTPSALTLPGIVVTGVGRPRSIQDAWRPTSALDGAELDRRLQSSLAATLLGEPGIALRSFGPVTAQPVIRGMSGDRILVLEDGQRTGDLSSMSADHAVGIDPVGAERIEVVRGPAGLLYGSQVLGGVINVIRGDIPLRPVAGATGSASLQGSSVNDGWVLGLLGNAPFRESVVLQGALSFRATGDLKTPEGPLPATESTGVNAALGGTWFRPWGRVGLSARGYQLDHGVPGEFQGVQIPGAHENGVFIESTRQIVRLAVERNRAWGPIDGAELEGSVVRYRHEEIEGTLASGDRVIGTAFDQLSGALKGWVRYAQEGTEGRRRDGSMGIQLWGQDLLTGGAYPGSRDARALNAALFAFEEVDLGDVQLQGGLRLDWHRIEPRDLRPIVFGNETYPVATRTYTDVSGSVGGLWNPSPRWALGVNVARAFRAPSVPELFSNGPHLADFAYDVGNPVLGAETALGVDLFIRTTLDRVQGELTVFQNHVDDYIYGRPTGVLDPRFQRFPVFASGGEDARFVGMDGQISVELSPALTAGGTLNFVRGSFRVTGEPLPAMPPINGRAHVRWEQNGRMFELGWRGAARQDRVPLELPPVEPGGNSVLPDPPTDGYHLFRIGTGLEWSMGGRDHRLHLEVDNLLNRSWRDHLSRARSVAPEPGRNVQLLYRLSWGS